MDIKVLKAFVTELTQEKLASKLRGMVEVVREHAAPKHLNYYSLMLKGDVPREIGRLKSEVSSSSSPGFRKVLETHIDPEFRGMGLGKKLYGEALKEGPLASDTHVSDAAARVWRGMQNRKGYSVQETPALQHAGFSMPSEGSMTGLTTGSGQPVFRANLNIPKR